MRFLSIALSLVPLAACNGGSGGEEGPGTLTLLATDAPLDPALLERATLTIDQIRIHREADGESGFLTLYEGAPFDVELSVLRNGIVQGLAGAELPAGEYAQLRFRMTGAELELTNGNLYTTDAGTLELSSHGTSGLKVFLDPPVAVRPARETRVLIDFDMTRTFTPRPPHDPLTATSFRMHPLIRTAVLEETGEIRGVVGSDNGPSEFVPTGDATVSVLEPGETDLDSAVATSVSEQDGSFAVLGLPPGVYDVVVTCDAEQGRIDDARVVRQGITTLDVSIR